MSFSRSILTKSNIIFLSMTLFFWLGVDGYTDFEEQQNLYSDQPRWPVKRLSQISCHCCSHSFNSHCCLHCMNRLRIGKRSNAAKLQDFIQGTDFADDMDEGSSLMEENIQQNELTDRPNPVLTCSCCLRQMRRNPYSHWWPCCDQCNVLIQTARTVETARNPE